MHLAQAVEYGDQALPGAGQDFSWSQILAQFGFYPPALVPIAAAIANPTYSNIIAVDQAYRAGGYQAPSTLMNWLWGKYYRELPVRLPGYAATTIGDYLPLILIGAAFLFLSRRR